MHDVLKPIVPLFPRRTRNVKLTVACPVCEGRGTVSLPSHDGTIERGYKDPAGNTEVLEDCGCESGKVELLIDVRVLEDAIGDALGPVIDYVTRHLHKDDREWLRDDISTTSLSRDLMAGLEVTITAKVPR
jgi:hypothetical protein